MLSCAANLDISFTLNLWRLLGCSFFKRKEKNYSKWREMVNCSKVNCFWFSLVEVDFKSTRERFLGESSIRKHAIIEVSKCFLNDGKVQNTRSETTVTIFFPVRCGGAVTATQVPVSWEAGQCSIPSWTEFSSSRCCVGRALWRQQWVRVCSGIKIHRVSLYYVCSWER